MKKILLAILMIICLTVPVSAEIDVNSSINGEQVELSGSSNYSEVPISIQVFDNDRKYYMNQGQTNQDGKFQFSFKLAKEKKYRGRLNISGEKKEFELSLLSEDNGNNPEPVEKETAFIYIKGYKGVILEKTEVEIENNDTVLSITKRILNAKGISYVDRSGYISSIDGQAEFKKGTKSGWMFSLNGDFPDIGAGSVDVHDRDRIEWRYTTNLGEDIGGGGAAPKEEDGIQNKIDKIENVLDNKNSSEKDVTNAIKDVSNQLNKKADEVKSETDAKNLVKDVKDVSEIIEKAANKVKTEQGAKDLAKESVTIVKSLVKSAEKLVKEKDKKEIEKIADDNIKITLKVMDKIQDTEEITKLANDIIEVSGNLMTSIGKDNAKKLKQNAVEVAKKAVEKAGQQKVAKHELKVEGNKVVAKVSAHTMKDLVKQVAKTEKDMKEQLVKNKIGTIELEKKLAIAILGTGKEEIETNLPQGIMKTLKENGIEKVSIKTEVAGFNVTPKTFGDKASGKEIVLSAKKINRSELSALAKHKIPEGSPIVDLNAKVGQEKVSNFNEPIEVSIPYKGDVKEGEKVEVFYLKDHEIIESMGGEYDPITKTVTFKTSHFSKYFAKKVNKNIEKELKKTFTDLQGYDWAKDAIETMADKGIINGRVDKTFDPAANITRAEFATLVTKLIGYSTENMNVPFTDVSKDDWYYNYVGAAYKNGLIRGRSDTIFNPNGNITRQEMAVIIAKVLEQKGYEKGSLDKLSIFKDTENILPWAKDSVSLCVKEKIISGMQDEVFAPKQNANRAQAAVMLYKLDQLTK